MVPLVTICTCTCAGIRSQRRINGLQEWLATDEETFLHVRQQRDDLFYKGVIVNHRPRRQLLSVGTDRRRIVAGAHHALQIAGIVQLEFQADREIAHTIGATRLRGKGAR